MIKQSFNHLKLLSIFALTSSLAQAAYYDTLPSGVRLLALRQVQTSNITSSYNNNNSESPYSLHQNLNANALKDINTFTQQYFNELRAISPEAANKFSFGEYQANAKAQVNVNGFGFAYGLTDHITAYTSIPYYNARVDINFDRTKGNNHQEVASLIEASRRSDFDRVIADLTRQFPDGNGELLQSVMVNTLGYEPVGTWEGKGYGDLEFATVYRLTDFKNSGMALTLGGVAPTGKVEDPDILQDISFGDGQWDAFTEFGGGYKFNKYISMDSWFRYTYQFPMTRQLRVPYDEVFTLSADKDEFTVKLGNKFDYYLSNTLSVTEWFSLTPTYIFNYQAQSQYESKHAEANRILALNTNSMAHHMKLAASFSTVKLFLKKEFILPASLEVSGQTMFSGTNTPKYERFDFELRFFF